MAKKIHSFLDNPWVAFPLCVLMLILFMELGFYIDRVTGH